MKKHEIARKKSESLKPPFSAADLKIIRSSFDISQADFARLLRVEKSWITKREQGVSRMTASDTALYQAILHIRNHKCLHEWLGDC